MTQNNSHLLFPMHLGLVGPIHASVQLVSQMKTAWAGVATAGHAEVSSMGLSHAHVPHMPLACWLRHGLRLRCLRYTHDNHGGTREEAEVLKHFVIPLLSVRFVMVPRAKESHMVRPRVTVDTAYRVTGQRDEYTEDIHWGC